MTADLRGRVPGGPAAPPRLPSAGGRGPASAPPRRTPLQVLLAVAGLAFALTAVAAGSLNLLNWVARQEATQTRTYAAPPQRLELLVDGDVTLSPSPDGNLHVHRRTTYSFRAPQFEEGPAGDALALRATCWFPPACEVDYDVQVPVDVVTEVSARSRVGSIDARGLRGRVELDSAAGGVRGADLDGEVELRSSAGDVVAGGLRGPRVEAQSSAGDVELSFAAAPEQVLARSSAGDVDVAVPPGEEAYRVQSDSRRSAPYVGQRDGGDSDGDDVTVSVRVDDGSARVIRVATSAGQARVHYR